MHDLVIQGFSYGLFSTWQNIVLLLVWFFDVSHFCNRDTLYCMEQIIWDLGCMGVSKYKTQIIPVVA